MTTVKICGIRDLQAAQNATSAGADFLGFNFVPSSKRYISPQKAADIMQHVRGTTRLVGVFQDAPIDEVNRLAADLDLNFVQLHGRETPEYVAAMDTPVIKTISVSDSLAEMMTTLERYDVPYFLLDRQVQGRGAMVDPQKAKALAARFSLFVAGGLMSQNVARIINDTRPFGVDVASGIETGGEIDPAKVLSFITHAKGGQP